MKKPLLVLLCFALFVCASAFGQRAEISLDGKWKIAEGSFSKIPEEFNSEIQVPGFVDMAEPAFKDVGAKLVKGRGLKPHYPVDELREAFWYKREFEFNFDLPKVAYIKLSKAAFSAKVYINGHFAGEHKPSYTAGYFDIRPFLKKGKNEIKIALGASPASMGGGFNDGIDPEKSIYLPGIYDSVTLVATGGYFVENIQLAPNIGESKVRVVAEIRNYEDAPRKANDRKLVETKTKHYKPFDVDVDIFERDSKRLVASKKVKNFTVMPMSMGKLDIEVEIPEAKLWSPESPFLYEVRVRTPNDSCAVRLGMREFTSSPEEGVFKLNGKPYYLRGTNITFLRFSEDPMRGNLPWDRNWVRKLYKNMKDFNFNSVRHCIGFPPDFWYEIADELGILIQDEFPIWLGGPERECQNTVIRTECLIAEFKEWMRERWNCPSVVIWDACNETTYVKQIADAILAVRDLDLSGRIWDNGWGPQMRYGDTVECHPYLASRLKWEKNFKDFPQICAKQDGGGYLVVNHYETGDGPFVINEYAWLWLNRDGSPTSLTDSVYEKLLGKNSTPEQRRLTYARYFAMLSELWRTSRKNAAVLHFCFLGYSREGGATCDNFLDVKEQIFEPNFKKYAKDAFAPLGLMIDYFETPQKSSSKVHMGVKLVNDTSEVFDASVNLQISDADGSILFNKTNRVQILPNGKAETGFEIKLPDKPGRYEMCAKILDTGTESHRYLNIEK